MRAHYFFVFFVNIFDGIVSGQEPVQSLSNNPNSITIIICDFEVRTAVFG